MVGSKTQILQRYEIERLGGVIPDKGHTNPGTAYIPEKDVMQVKAAARRAGVDVYRLNGYDKDIGGGLYRFEKTTTFESKKEFESHIFVEDEPVASGKLTKDAIEDAIPCDAKDGLLDVNEPDGSFGRYTWYVRFAPGSQDEAEDAAEAIESALGRRTQVADFGRFVAVIVKPTRDDIVGESSKMEFTITEITEWDEDRWLIDGDSSRENPRTVRRLVEQEREEKEEGEWTKGLPFTCIAENFDDALDQYNQKFCEYDYLKAIDAEYDVREPEEEVEVLGTRLRG